MKEPSAGAPRATRVQVTDRDRLVLEFIAEHRLVLAGHVQALLGVSAAAATRRLRALARAGLLTQETIFHGCASCYRATRKGLGVVGSELPTPKLDYRGYKHDVGIAWLWLAAHRGAFGPLAEVVAERQMRSRDGSVRSVRSPLGASTRSLFGVRLGGSGPGGQPRLHYPDLLLIDDGGRRIAVELELTPKSKARREKIIRGYAADRRIDAVLYLVEDPRIARAVAATARRFGFEQQLLVQPVRFGAGQVPDRGPALARASARSRALVR